MSMKKLNLDGGKFRYYIENVLNKERDYFINTIIKGNGLFQYTFLHRTQPQELALINVYENNDGTTTINPYVGKNQPLSVILAKEIINYSQIVECKSTNLCNEIEVDVKSFGYGLERERKFLLLNDRFDSSGFTKKSIEQGYLVIEGESHTRVRIIDEQKGFITFKQGVTDIDRNEFEFPISLSDAKQLMRSTQRKLIKTRFSKKVGDIKIDVDKYADRPNVVEIEYTSDVLPNDLIPNYCGEDVTGVEEYSNIFIATLNEKRFKEKNPEVNTESDFKYPSLSDKFNEYVPRIDENIKEDVKIEKISTAGVYGSIRDELFQVSSDVPVFDENLNVIGDAELKEAFIDEPEQPESVPEIDVVRELKTTLSEPEMRHCFGLIFTEDHSSSFMKAELEDIFFNRDYWFINAHRPNWYNNVINYLDSIGFDTNKLMMNPAFYGRS